MLCCARIYYCAYVGNLGAGTRTLATKSVSRGLFDFCSACLIHLSHCKSPDVSLAADKDNMLGWLASSTAREGSI